MRMRLFVNKNGKNMTFNLQSTTVADGFKSVCIFIPFRNRLSNWLHIPYIHSIHTIYIYVCMSICEYIYIYIIRINHFIAQHTHTHVYKYARIEQTIDLHLSAPHQTKHSRCKREVHLHVTCMNSYNGWSNSSTQNIWMKQFSNAKGLGCVFLDQQVLRWPTE